MHPHEQREAVTSTAATAVKIAPPVSVIEQVSICAPACRAWPRDALVPAANHPISQELAADAKARQDFGPVNAGVYVVGAKKCGDGAHAGTTRNDP
jgi:hypothetical protein